MSFTSTPRYRVLCFSRDHVLGETRRSVLQRQFDTVFVESLQELTALTSGAPFDVIVLCHTLSLGECAACLEIAKRVWGSARIISVASETGSRQIDFGETVIGLDGPRALLDAVQQVLQPTLTGIAPS